MKKVLLGVLAALLVSVGPAASVGAEPAKTDVTGVVTREGEAVGGADVTVMCDGNKATDVTDSRGSYLVSFLKQDCPFGATVKVTAKKGNFSGGSSGTVRGITTKLNVGVINVSIPEYGLIGAVTAAGLGIGFIAFNRRRQATTSNPIAAA